MKYSCSIGYSQETGSNRWEYDGEKSPYLSPTEYLFLDQKRKLKMVARLKKNIAKLELKPEDLGFSLTLVSTN